MDDVHSSTVSPNPHSNENFNFVQPRAIDDQPMFWADYL